MFDKNISIRGIHASYLKSLCKGSPEKNSAEKENNEFRVFNRYLDAYMVAPLIGCYYNRKGKIDTENSNDEASMNANILIRNQEELMKIYRTIVLVDKSSNYSDEERINRAFKGDLDDKISDENMKLFTEYFLGGLEILYDKFIQSCTTTDDYLDQMFDYVDTFAGAIYSENNELNLDSI